MLIKLSDEDRKDLAVDAEVVEFDQGRLSAREAARLQDIGYATPAEWAAALDRAGFVVAEDSWRRLYHGVQFGKDGERLDGHVDYLAWCALVWLALRRAGHKIAWDDCDMDVFALRVAFDPEPDPAAETDPAADAGKDPSTPDIPSPPGSSTTPPP